MDGEIDLVAGAFSSSGGKSRVQGKELMLEPDRVYNSYEEVIMKYGLNTLIFTGSFKDENTVLFERIKKTGFDGVEIALAQKGDLDYDRTLRQLKNNGLECSGKRMVSYGSDSFSSRFI